MSSLPIFFMNIFFFLNWFLHFRCSGCSIWTILFELEVILMIFFFANYISGKYSLITPLTVWWALNILCYITDKRHRISASMADGSLVLCCCTLGRILASSFYEPNLRASPPQIDLLTIVGGLTLALHSCV